MASMNITMITLLTISAFMVTTTTLTIVMASRELTSMNKPTTISKTLAVRLNGEAGDGLAECWSALSEVHSCTKEIIVLFLDHGETNLSFECCRAVSTLCHDCWPSMLTSLGFTSGESGTLRDHCDTSPSVPPQSTPTYVVSPPRPTPTNAVSPPTPSTTYVVSPPPPSPTNVVSPPTPSTTYVVSPPRTTPINVVSPPPAGCPNSTAAAHPKVIG
ncbi:hypothetical protein MKW98_001151 [Papaver atlanticum]|uniref:Prolamin-like domain-containing protein n=1 Tax=Papaver atlanticum TaxID=357466 RepID=A0AAD4SRI2_9MAGN|nr:hypothetical protein MKW98_001151 [Papaver atlanticum]